MTDVRRITPQAAWSTLFDALSAGFTYPAQALIDALESGDYIAVIQEAISALPCRDEIRTACHALETGIATLRDQGSLARLGSDYISLFDSNIERRPAHPYAHLYHQTTDHISLLRRLQALYHNFGTSLKAGQGADQPDHLTVQLEFIAWLHQQLDRSDIDATRRLQVCTGIRTMHEELSWLDSFLRAIQALPTHVFYHPLTTFLSAVHSCHTTAWSTGSQCTDT